MAIQIQDLLDLINEKYSKCSYFRCKGVITEFHLNDSARNIFEIEYTKPDNLILKTYEKGVIDEDDMTITIVKDRKVTTKFSKSRLERSKTVKSNFNRRRGWEKWLGNKLSEFEQSGLNELSKTRPLDEVTIFDSGYVTSMVYYHWFTKLRRPWTKERCALLSDKVINGLPCYHIRCIEEPVQVWVSKEYLLIRKVEMELVSSMSYWHKSLMQNLAKLSLATYGDRLKETAPEFADMLKMTSENYPDDYRTGEFEEIEIRF